MPAVVEPFTAVALAVKRAGRRCPVCGVPVTRGDACVRVGVAHAARIVHEACHKKRSGLR